MTGSNIVFVMLLPSGTFFKFLPQYLLCWIVAVT